MRTILSAAMLLRYSLGMEEAAQTIERAVERTLAAGPRTADIARTGEATVGTDAMGERVLEAL